MNATDLDERTWEEFEHSGGESQDMFPVLSCAELAASDLSIDYLIDGIAVRGQPGIIGGPEKSLKTTLCIDFAISLATATKFLGHFPVKRSAKVLFCSGESGLATIRGTGQDIAAKRDLDFREIGLLWSDNLPNLGRPQELQRLLRTVRHHGVECLIVDPVYLAMPTCTPWSLFEQGALLREISAGCQDVGATLVLVHHQRKNRGEHNPFGPPRLSDLSGSGFAEYARWWICLNRREEYLAPEPHRLWMATGGSAGHCGTWAVDVDNAQLVPGLSRRWNVQLQTMAQSKQEAARRAEDAKANKKQCQLERDAEKVLGALRQHPNGETKTVLRGGLNGTRGTAAIDFLVEQGRIIPVTFKKAGRSVDGYRLAYQDSTRTNGTGPAGPM